MQQNCLLSLYFKQVRTNTSSQPWNPANKTCGACATLPHPEPEQRHTGTSGQLPLKAASRLLQGIYPEKQQEIFPFSFHIRFSDQCSSQPLLLWAAHSVECSFPVYPHIPFYYQADFFFLKHTQAPACFFLKLYRDLSASFAASHPVFRQSSCLVKNNNFWMSLQVPCF